MRQFSYPLALAASVIVAATGAATAAGGPHPDATHGSGSIGTAEATASFRPDDRANHGPGALVRDTSSEIVRPDDRAWRGAGSAPSAEIVESPSVRVDGFDWADAGIGATAAFGLGLLLVGASALVRRRQHVTAVT